MYRDPTKVSKSEKSIKRDLNPLHSVWHRLAQEPQPLHPVTATVAAANHYYPPFIDKP